MEVGVFAGSEPVDLHGSGINQVRAIKIVDIGQSASPTTYGVDVRYAKAFNYNKILTAGDANEDGHFNTADIGQVILSNKYGTGKPADWSQGDFNGDGLFDQLDLVLAMQEDWYLA